MRRAVWWVPVLLLAGFLFAPTHAEAGGFYLPNRGVRPMGRGGAMVASGGGDLNGIWYNPAHLAGIESTKFVGDVAVLGAFSSFKRAPRTTRSGETETYPRVSNQALPVPDPQLLIGGPTGLLEGLTWSAGLYAPYAAHFSYPEDGPQRYSLVSNAGSAMAFLSGSLGYQITDDLRVGAGFQNMVAHFELTTVISGYSGLYGRPEDRDLDILSSITVQDLVMPTGNLGVWYRPASSIELGASVQLPAKVYDKDAELDVRMPSHASFDDAELDNDTLEAQLQLPVVARLGVRYVGAGWDLELAGVFEGWSVLDEITAEPNDIRVQGVPGVGSLPVGALSIPKNWRDTVSVRLGGSYRWSNKLTTRAGYTFETGAPPPEGYSVFQPDPPKHVASAGMTYAFESFNFDLSAAYYALHNLTITNSEARQINPVDTDDELATVVGNGDYRNSYLVVGAGIEYLF